MPGILPMKVIKVGTSAQSRIAQACDRCRSKKIRCDGVRPTCTQCANVGFECRTSDKLSRRAFPRGYTESLEERVRALETEVRELKDLLDEKDEKIDMLSKMHSNRKKSNAPSRDASAVRSPSGNDLVVTREDTFKVQTPPLLLGVENSDSYFMGPSSGRAFIEILKRKMEETGKPCQDFNPEAYLHIQGTKPLTESELDKDLGAPPRLFSDRCVNVYFQEWAPLFPVLHKPTFLGIYEEFALSPSKIKSNYKIAQLNLVFSIAGLSLESPDLPQLVACEEQWTKALDSLLLENTMNTLQCLILALMYCTMRADYKKIQHYKGIAVSLSHRLGLHQTQKRFSFGALTIETRKKVFWTLYTLDCFTAATLGLPKLLKEDDIQAEYPSDADDEYVTEAGFQPTLPGESTRLSSALALFKGARIMARVLDRNYPSSSSHELSLQQMETLESELDTWYGDLPSHLRLNFVQDKPSTDVTGSRSPLLALAYYYIRILIFRPAVGSSLGHKAAPAIMSISESSKHIVQIIQLLEERNMIFSFCLNKADLLIICGMTLLYQVLDLKKESKMMRDNERLINAVIKIGERTKAPGFLNFQRIASKFVTTPGNDTPAQPSKLCQRTASLNSQRTSQPRKKSPLGQHQLTSSESDLLQGQERMRRMTMPSLQGQRPGLSRSQSRPSFEIVAQDSVPEFRQHRLSLSAMSSRNLKPHPTQNLDYLSLGTTPSHSRHSSPPRNRMQPPPTIPRHHNGQPIQSQATSKQDNVSSTDWELMLGSIDGGLNNVYDAIYGGSTFGTEASLGTTTRSTRSDWSPDTWDLSTFSIGDFTTGPPSNPAAPQSVFSLSDDSLSSGEDAGSADPGLGLSNGEYQGNVLTSDGLFLDSLEGFGF